MPRFYFDLKNGKEFIRDDEGVEVDDHRYALSEAQTVLSQMQDDADWNPADNWTLIIRNEDGVTVGTLDVA